MNVHDIVTNLSNNGDGKDNERNRKTNAQCNHYTIMTTITPDVTRTRNILTQKPEVTTALVTLTPVFQTLSVNQR